ncbi:type II secretion system protein GspL [Paracoccus sp. WLY502]|uniref:type II secretion system protein GspL n=1 Tax=Paracoccus yibinensis TaxID=3068891 RepID=UPI0027968FD4|nr:type II secretion system protein GspL [Paracoccus sp. WLY502]MDQ1901652.1 type II secretion system protein GspL [Paracoccus sp. WLY502]
MNEPAITAAAPSHAGMRIPLIASRSAHGPDGATSATASDMTFIPGEDVLLLSVELPAMSPAQRRAAIGFAVEDSLAQPLDQVHVALGPQLASGSWLVGVASRDLLAGIAVPQGHRLVPDTLVVPAPDTGWAVLGQDGRVLVRLPDGSGFAADPMWTAQLWQFAGMPPILSYGGPLPQDMTVTETARLPQAPDEVLAQFDLRAGLSMAEGFRLSRGWAMPIGILSAFVLGHLMIAAVDLLALNRIEADRAEQLRTLLAASGISADDDLSDAVSRALVAQQPSAQGTFLDLSSEIFAAISDHAGDVALRELRYTSSQDSIVMAIEAASLEALQDVENTLLSAGLAVQTGAATTAEDKAEVQMTVGRSAP